jgi:hypothetical protein
MLTWWLALPLPPLGAFPGDSRRFELSEHRDAASGDDSGRVVTPCDDTIHEASFDGTLLQRVVEVLVDDVKANLHARALVERELECVTEAHLELVELLFGLVRPGLVGTVGVGVHVRRDEEQTILGLPAPNTMHVACLQESAPEAGGRCRGRVNAQGGCNQYVHGCLSPNLVST